jgi:CheY-like chemotaxis protein
MAASTEMRRPLKILVVDDEDGILEVFRLALVPCGHEVTFVKSGPEAIELASQQQFDVAFIDIAMSPMDGLSALSRLKAVSPNTRYIMITAFYSGELSRRVRSNIVSDAMRLGARGCLRKPFELDTIVQAAEYFGRQAANARPAAAG